MHQLLKLRYKTDFKEDYEQTFRSEYIDKILEMLSDEKTSEHSDNSDSGSDGANAREGSLRNFLASEASVHINREDLLGITDYSNAILLEDDMDT